MIAYHAIILILAGFALVENIYGFSMKAAFSVNISTECKRIQLNWQICVDVGLIW